MEIIINIIVFILCTLLISAKILVLLLIAYILWNYIKGDRKSKDIYNDIKQDIKGDNQSLFLFQLNYRTNTYKTMTNLLKQCEEFVGTKPAKPKTKADLLDIIKANNNAMLDYVSTMQNLLHKAQKRDKQFSFFFKLDIKYAYLSVSTIQSNNPYKLCYNNYINSNITLKH